MMDYSRFTPNARSAIQKAHSIALSCSYVEVTPSIQMVGIIQEARDMIFFLLQQMEVDKVAFCQSVSDTLATIEQRQNCQPDNSDALTQILQKSIQLASESESSLAGVEHIFWAYAIVRNELSDVFRHYNMTERKVLQAVQTYRNGNMESPSETAETQGAPSSLSKYSRNLNALASDGIIEPSIGRDEEVRRVLQILSRKTKNNPILVGEPGTGKTAIVEGIAHRIVRGDVPQDMQGLKIFTLDLSLLIAGASMQGEFENRLKSIIEEAKSDKDIVLFIDEIHLLIGAGRTSGAMDAANIIKPELARGEIRVIGATTFEEYRKYIESDKAFARRLQKITVDEPDEEASIAILRGIKSRFESHHRIKILDEAVVASVKLSIRYITDRFLPDKAIDLLDEAASKMRMERSSVPEALDNLTRTIRCKEIEKQSVLQDGQSNSQLLETLDLEIAELREKENTLNAKWRNERQQFELIQTLQDELERYKINREQEESLNRFEQAALLQRRIDEVESRIDELIHDFSEENNPLLKMSLDENDIRKVITIWTGIPVEELGEDETDQLLNLETNLQSSVIGQNEAIHSVANIVRRNRMGFSNSNKPIGSFLFLGTTGVGKTELAKALAQYLFHSQDLIIRIDMSEYQQEHSVSRLFGAPPGYVGYDQGGQLLDEIEKAHSKVFETLLQVLDDGRMTDGQGHVVDFKNTIIIMTSNLGATFIAEHIGDDSFSETKPMLIQQIVQLLKQKVSSEFVNRIDEFLLFNPLTKDAIRKISILQLTRLKEKLSKNGINIIIEDDVINYIVECGFDPEMGARPIKRVIDKLIVDPLAENILSSRISKDKQIIISYLNNGLVFHN